MKIRHIINEKGTNIITVTPEQSVQEAIAILVEHNIGSLLVMKGKEVVGIITERDVLNEYNKNLQLLSEKKVQDVMTKQLIICGPDDDIDDIMSVMTEKHIRHLPIILNGEVKGMISIGDIVKSQLHEHEHQIKYLSDYITGSRI